MKKTLTYRLGLGPFVTRLADKRLAGRRLSQKSLKASPSASPAAPGRNTMIHVTPEELATRVATLKVPLNSETALYTYLESNLKSAKMRKMLHDAPEPKETGEARAYRK